MRKIFILPVILLLVITITSCKKSSSGSVSALDSSNTITAIINDTLYSFNTQIVTQVDTSINSTSLLIEGFNSDTTSRILLFLNSEARPNITDTVFTNMSTTNDAGITYSPNITTLSEADTVYSWAYDSNPASLTVTSITDSSIQGTFQGNIYLQDSVSADAGDPKLPYKTVTNGKFNVKVHF